MHAVHSNSVWLKVTKFVACQATAVVTIAEFQMTAERAEIADVEQLKALAMLSPLTPTKRRRGKLTTQRSYKILKLNGVTNGEEVMVNELSDIKIKMRMKRVTL